MIPPIEDHKMMVELACGTALALGYYEPILKSVFPSITPDECIVIVVCGGVKTTLSYIKQGGSWLQYVSMYT
jgi:hypothetical protein